MDALKKIIIIILLLFPLSLSAAENEGGPNSVLGDFEIVGFLSAGAGWQRQMGGVSTEFAEDGSFAGVLGSVLPNSITGNPPQKNEDTLESFVEIMELDFIKEIGERAKMRADLVFGRVLSGSAIFPPGLTVEQAYAAVTLSKPHNIEFLIGRFGTTAGYEPFEPYNNDTISWSIASRSRVYPVIVTGMQLSAALTENIDILLALANSLTDDTLIKTNDAPAGFATIKFTWGQADAKNSFSLTPFIGPESGSNRHLSFGADAVFNMWLAKDILLGLEGDLRRDNGFGGPNTNYAMGLLDLRFDLKENLYTVIRYSYAWQSEDGNGVLNLTGAKQQIHEISLGGGYMLTDSMKLKFEGRFDIVDPAVGATQYVPGVAGGIVCAF